MSVAIYDKALLTKFKRWIKNKDLTVLGVDQTSRLFRYKADITDDKPIQLPLISLSRESTVSIISTSKRPLSFDGFKDINKSLQQQTIDKTNQLNAIPIRIKYQLDIYCRYVEEVEEYVRNFVFNIINYPKLDIEIPYKNSKIISNSYLSIDSDINDNSDISERLIEDQFARRTITFSLNDAYLYDYKTLDNWKIDTGIEIIVALDDSELAAVESIDIKNEN